MARKTPSRLELRKQVEAVEAIEEAAVKEKKPRKVAAPRVKKVKEKAQIRKRLLWVVYSGSMKEEGRFPYDQRAAAEEKIEQLKLKSKKMYFIQPVKEIIGADGTSVPIVPVSIDLDDEPVKPKKKVAKSDDDEDDGDSEPDDDDDE